MKSPPRRWLRLTSPYMSGPDVRALQEAVNKRFAARGRPGIKVDGDYGPSSRDAVRATLWYLGCPSDQLDAGATIDHQAAIRDPEHHRPSGWYPIAQDRNQWLDEEQEGRDRFLDWCRGYVGKVEQPPGSNRGPWLDPLLHQAGFRPGKGVKGPPYCAIGLMAGYRAAGVDCDTDWPYTPNWVRDAHNGRYGWRWVPTSQLQAGDAFFIKIPGVSNDVCDHVGTVEKPKVSTIEFNTSSGKSGSQNNGGQVARRDWADRAGMCIGGARPPWKH